MQINLSAEVSEKYEELREYYQAHDNDILELAITSLYSRVKVKARILKLNKQLQEVN
jgi:hypothetical protein